MTFISETLLVENYGNFTIEKNIKTAKKITKSKLNSNK